MLCEIVWRGDEAATLAPFDAVSPPKRAKLTLVYRGEKLVLRRSVEEITLGRDADCRIVVDGEHALAPPLHDRAPPRPLRARRQEHQRHLRHHRRRPGVALRRDEITLRKSGWISFGQPRSAAGDDVMEFVCD